MKEYLTQRNVRIDEDIIRQALATLASGKHLILIGPPGTGKTELACAIACAHDMKLVIKTATSEWTRIDTIGGPIFKGGKVIWKSGVLLEAIVKAYTSRQGCILIIDEINRANIDRAFGEFFTIFSSSDTSTWEIPSSILEEILEYSKSREEMLVDEYAEKVLKLWNQFKGRFDGLKVPENFRIIGTMNTFDRRYLFTLGSALLRRFAIIEVTNPKIEDSEFKEIIVQYLPKSKVDVVDRILRLYRSMRNFVELGIALLIDTAKYITELINHGEDNVRNALDQAVSAIIIPQLEGLSIDKLRKIKQLLESEELVFSSHLLYELYPEISEASL